jgi:tetratricopeptide (TPR) repeat protein
MNDHELWNEIGNLYYLSGAENQAVFAYNKAIHTESSYGKPYGNLALIYAKQANYEKAIDFYNKCLVLLKNDEEKATAWSRLGNIYWQLKKFQEAAFAYQRADALRSGFKDPLEQPDPLLHIFSESQSYDLVEAQDSQNHAVECLEEADLELNDAISESASLEGEMQAEEIEDFDDAARDPITEVNFESGPSFSDSEVEIPLSIELESEPSSSPENTEDGNPFPEVEENPGDKLEEQINFNEFFSESFNESESQASETSESPGYPFPAEEIETEMETSEPAPLAEHACPEGTSEEESGVDVRHEVQPDEPGPLFMEPDTRSDEIVSMADSEVSGSIDPAQKVIEVQPVEIEPTEMELEILPVIESQDMDSASTNPIAQDLEKIESSEQELYSPVDDSVSDQPIGQTFDEIALEAQKEMIDEEEKNLERQIEINPRSATTWEALGTLYKTASRYDEAIEAFKHAISIAPGKVAYYHNLGLVYSAQGNNTEAFNTFQKVLELDPNHSLTHASLGGYYKKMGLDELAQKHIGKAMKSIYESENEYNRACLDAICGNIDQAIELLRTALENKQTYVDWVIHDPDLDALRDDERFKLLISEFSS